MADTSLTLAALRQRRELTIARLCEHFALDHLEASELEERIDRAHQATSLAELDSLLAGLPDLAAAPGRGVAPRPREGSDHQVVVAVMGGAERKGGWTPARSVYVTAVMGGALLDFRHAQMPAGVTDVYVLAIMGGVQIVVPPDIHVESNGIGIMGGFEHAGQGRFPVDGSVPVLRVSGAAIMGGVEILVRAPGDPTRSDLRLERRERRRLERGEPRDGSGWTEP